MTCNPAESIYCNRVDCPTCHGTVGKASAATDALRDAVRDGRVIDYRQRDTWVMDIHRALDALLVPPPKPVYREPRKLTTVTIEEYIEANGGMLSFLEGFNDFAKENGMDWLREIQYMMNEAERKARFFSRMRL